MEYGIVGTCLLSGQEVKASQNILHYHTAAAGGKGLTAVEHKRECSGCKEP